MAKADVGEELRQRWGTSEDLEEDLEEESEPIHHCSPHLQRPRHVHLCGSHALHDPRSMIDASGNGKGAILVYPEEEEEEEEGSGALREHAGVEVAQSYWRTAASRLTKPPSHALSLSIAKFH